VPSPALVRLHADAYAAAIFPSAALLSQAAAVRRDGAAAARRVAAGVVGGDGFFQAALLAGYAYAHLLTRRLPDAFPSSSMWGHDRCDVGVALAIASGWGKPPAQGETLWLLGLFAVSIGLLFFALSANGPLRRRGSHAPSIPRHDPYFLMRATQLSR
jgi:hypothetical protein